jgi:hypothetical protein
MKRRNNQHYKRLVLSKETIAALNEAHQNHIIGGETTDLGLQPGIQPNPRPTMGLGVELSRCCPVYVPSVNVACIS